ncbi:hypothetical protein [Nostocoides sp.]
MAQYRAGIADQAKSIALRNLVLSELIRAEQLTVSEEELAERATRIATQDYAEHDAEADEAGEEHQHDHTAEIKGLVEFFTQGGGRTMLASQLLTEKAFTRLTAIVSGEEVSGPDQQRIRRRQCCGRAARGR